MTISNVTVRGTWNDFSATSNGLENVMTAVFLVIHLMLAIGLVTAVLLQRSDGGALGGLGGGGGPAGGFGGLMSGRQSANLLTRTTAILAACFMGTSLLLAILAAHRSQPSSILEIPAELEQTLPSPSEDNSEPSTPTAPIAD